MEMGRYTNDTAIEETLNEEHEVAIARIKELARYWEVLRDPIIKRNYWLTNRDRLNLMHRSKLRGNKARGVAYLGGACVDCGLRTCLVSVYDFDHKNPAEKDRNIDFSIWMALPWPLLRIEFDKCVLRCANCHRIRHHPYCAEAAA